MTFELAPCGDPFNAHGWDVREMIPGEAGRCWFRGDLSPIQGRDNAIGTLRRLYPGCVVQFESPHRRRRLPRR